MAWICEYCSTNNDDSVEECFVCGCKKAVKVTKEKVRTAKAPKIATKRKITLLSVILAGVMIISFILGQILSYSEYDNYGRILVITNMIIATENYTFNSLVFLILTSIIGLAALVGHIRLTTNFINKSKYTIAVILTFVCGIALTIFPSVISLAMAVFSIIFCFKFTTKQKIYLAILYILCIAAIIISMPIIWEVWWINF